MHKRTSAVCLSALFLSAILLAGTAWGDPPRPLFPRLGPVPKTPAMYGYHPPKAGPRPYYGEALGATYYNWGFFGAKRNPQLTTHTGYDSDYSQWGHAKGY